MSNFSKFTIQNLICTLRHEQGSGSDVVIGVGIDSIQEKYITPGQFYAVAGF